MKRGIRIVAPYLPLKPESDLHKETADFDWIAAIKMMRHSAELACHCEVHVITDVTADLPVPCFKYATTHRRLMLWVLEACCCYLESADFDRDTVMLDCDQLVYRDLARWMTPLANFGVLIRPTAKHQAETKGQPLLNGVQWWRRTHRDALVAFYRQALATAEQMSEGAIRWGADTDAVRELLEPLEVGLQERAGMTVRMIDADEVLEALSEQQILWLKQGRMPWPSRAVLDFRWKRKRFMPAAYQATIMKNAVADGVVA